MIRLTHRQWAATTCGLWLCLVVSMVTLDGLPRVIVQLALLVGFLTLCVERWQNYREAREAGRRDG